MKYLYKTKKYPFSILFCLFLLFFYLGRCEVTPSLLQHNHNGRFIAVIGEGEYVVYTSRQLRSKAYGEGIHFIWRQNSNQYCIQIVLLLRKSVLLIE